MCVINTNATKKGPNKCPMRVDYVLLLFISFCGLTKFLFSRLEKVSPTKHNEEKNVCVKYTFSWWLGVEVECKKEEECVDSVN